MRRSWASLSLCSSQGGLLVEVGGRRCGRRSGGEGEESELAVGLGQGSLGMTADVSLLGGS